MSTRRQRHKPFRRKAGAPAVIFVDDLRWDAFGQLAARLRHSGIRTVRVTTERGGLTRLATRLLFDRYVILDTRGGNETLRRVLGEENVIDVQVVETFKDLIANSLDRLEPAIAESVQKRLAMMDKYSASRTFAQVGVRTPAVMLASGERPGTVAAQLGLPVVAKARVGCGGGDVVILVSLDELEVAHESLDCAPVGRYFEQFIHGVKLNYAATVSEDGIEQELTYRVSSWLMPVGTATEIETIDDPALAEFGRRAVLASNCTGLINMDIIRDDKGLDWLIDFNARAFGGGANFLSIGVDVSDGYLRSLGRRDVAVVRRFAAANSKICIFPASLGEVLNEGSYRALIVEFLREARPYVKWLGWRYSLSEPLRVIDVAATLRERRRAKRATTPGEVAEVPSVSDEKVGEALATRRLQEVKVTELVR